MDLALPPGAPAWLGWVLFVGLAIVSVSREIGRNRTEGASVQKMRLESQKISLDILSASSEGYERQLRSITEALAANALRYSPEQIEALREGWPGRPATASPGVADHLAARERARAELPLVIDQLTAVQKRQVDLARDVSQGVVLKDSVLADVRQRTEKVASDVDELIRLIASSPRIYVSEVQPDDAREGDLFVMVPPGSLSHDEGDPPAVGGGA
ncbi:hypothetical protein [Cellulomonas alba]|uniref:Uncharacterized protein n=1 Tax=Cellulomonas alba TaxID=3053467 RepID=A0ABT7SDH1_9CELL|nr:hypothetical protein [Cellulomonas alba]MDM7854104.1 hypothetical protein [Cellulomonas alba]